MGKVKRKKKKRSIPIKPIPHKEGIRALKIINHHPAVVGDPTFPYPIENGGFQIEFNITVSLPSRLKKIGKSDTGVKKQEHVIMRFPPYYPFKAPVILLRQDFNSNLPHLNPIFRLKDKKYIVPCVYDGPLEDLLHQEGDGLSEILNQLSEWLGKAAIDDLIDPNQGWEPIRRDDNYGWIVYDLKGLRDLVTEKQGFHTFQCRFWKREDRSYPLYFVGRTNHAKARDISPWLVKNSFFIEDNPVGPSYVCLMVFVWPSSGIITDKYLPEGVSNLTELHKNAKKYGCDKSLKDAFINLGWAMKEASLNLKSFPLFVVLCVRRPYKIIDDNSSLELIPYVVECHVEENSHRGFAESAVRIREESQVFPLGHRYALTSNLLRRMSGGRETMRNRPIVHIGCGSVGSKIALHLARSGAGPFKLIDNAAFSPHNVARHALIPLPEIPGQPKASFLAEEIKMLRTEAEPYDDDIATLVNHSEKIKKIFQDGSGLIIESTGSTAVRELLASLPPSKLSGRLIHAALYTSGMTGLMAIEGNHRNPSVSDLITRYWDLGIDDNGMRSKIDRFEDSMRRQDVGLGCGSHTMILPDTRISLYAAGMAERARQLLDRNFPQHGELWIGELDENELQVSWKLVELNKTNILTVKANNDWEVRILKQAMDQITKEVEKYSEIETGGVLIGRISLSRRCFTVSRVLDAPSDSKRSPTSFVLGINDLKTKVQEIFDKSTGYLNYIGTWHSHPKGGTPSDIDRISLERMKRHRFGAPAVSLIWTPSGFNAIIDEGKLS